jgi:predicted small integral membrane protein
MVKLVKVLLMASIALWGLIGGIANLMDYQGGYGAVAYVFSMTGAKEAPALWRAIDSPFLIHIGYAFIWVSKLATGLLCSICTVKLWHSRSSTASAFNASKTYGITGAGISMFMLFFGFVVVSGTYFELWRDAGLGAVAHQFAFIYIGCIGIITLFIAQPDTES